ncbi:hypothetical protein GmHk_13G039130 [Glycine max]|nr:hypothetical protein GmHk_13G039130 [Glycine max]
MQLHPTCEFNAFTWLSHIRSFTHQQHSPTLSRDLVPATLFRSATTTDDVLLREHFFADLHEGLNDDLVVARGVQLEEALEKLLEFGFCVDLSLQDHLEYGGSKILMWVV